MLEISAAPPSSVLRTFEKMDEMLMNLSLDAAKAFLAGGIDATSALSSALKGVLLHPSEDDYAGLKKSFGHAMASVLAPTVDIALQAYPELKHDRDAREEIAREYCKKGLHQD
ncbi:hypothetical protein [Pseudomonas sp. CF10PS3]